MTRVLTSDERKALRNVLDRVEPVTIDLWGEGSDRWISFFAMGTRLEARIAYPESKD